MYRKLHFKRFALCKMTLNVDRDHLENEDRLFDNNPYNYDFLRRSSTEFLSPVITICLVYLQSNTLVVSRLNSSRMIFGHCNWHRIFAVCRVCPDIGSEGVSSRPIVELVFNSEILHGWQLQLFYSMCINWRRRLGWPPRNSTQSLGVRKLQFLHGLSNVDCYCLTIISVTSTQ